jgi:hypothetical protein
VVCGLYSWGLVLSGGWSVEGGRLKFRETMAFSGKVALIHATVHPHQLMGEPTVFRQGRMVDLTN